MVKKRLQYLKTHGSTSGMVVWNLVVGAGDVEPLTSSYLEKVLSCGFVDLSIRRQRASAHCATGKRRSRGSGAARAGYLDVSAAHMVLVPLQRQVSVLLIDKTDEGFSVSPPLGIEAQRRPSSAKHNTRRMWTLRKQLGSHVRVCVCDNDDDDGRGLKSGVRTWRC